jgi:mannitol operon repressor
MPATNASIKALRAIARNTTIIPHTDLQKFIRSLTGRNDRLIGVVCGAMVENALSHLLTSAMPNGPGTLLDINGPISTFSAKISLAWSLGLINGDIRRNCDYIREVRNVFAHRVAVTSFRTKEVAAVCRLLKIIENPLVNATKKNQQKPQRSYFFVASLLTYLAIIKKIIALEKPNETPPASLFALDEDGKVEQQIIAEERAAENASPQVKSTKRQSATRIGC